MQRNITQPLPLLDTGHGQSGPRKQSIAMVHYWVRHAKFKCTWSSFIGDYISKTLCLKQSFQLPCMILLYWREFTKRKSIQGKLFVFLWNVSLHFSHTKGRTKTLGLVNPALLFLSPPSLPNSSSCVVFYWYFIGKGWSEKNSPSVA